MDIFRTEDEWNFDEENDGSQCELNHHTVRN
jgi:hypothetical protein